MPRPRKPARLYWREREQLWVIKDGDTERRTGCGVGEREAAEDALRDYLAGKPVARGPSRPDEITVGHVLAIYAQDKGQAMAAPKTLGHAIEALAPFWGDLTCDAVKGSTCRAYERHRAKPRTLRDGRTVTAGSSTVRRELGVLQAAMNHAHAEGVLIYPIKVTLTEAGEPRDRWATRSEVARLLKAAAPHCQRFILLSIYTGRRMQAVLDLTWTQVDLERGTIRFKQGRETSKRRGSIRIPARLLAHLRRWRALDRGRSMFVVPRPSRTASIRRAFEGARERSGVMDVTPHVLKHTAITWAIASGLSVEAAAEYFDTTADTIRKHYWHHSPHHQAEAIEIIGRR